MKIVFASYGNDSLATVCYCIEHKMKDVHVVFNDTGWADSQWINRVTYFEGLFKKYGITTHRTRSEGMEKLVKRKKGWPFDGGQFCTYELKIKPALMLMEKLDPDKKAVCLVGVRREESEKRKNYPRFVWGSEQHDGRKMWVPLADFTEKQRNDLLKKYGIEPLKHRSMECFPCINASRTDLLMIPESRIAEIERIENELGYTSNGKLRTMYRPKSKGGAIGIREVIKWAKSQRGKYDKNQAELFGNCESGWCGS